VAHDALTARLIELAGYPAYQIGGFALVGSRFAYLDIDLAQFGENSAASSWALADIFCTLETCSTGGPAPTG